MSGMRIRTRRGFTATAPLAGVVAMLGRAEDGEDKDFKDADVPDADVGPAAYVGSAACAPCHERLVSKHAFFERANCHDPHIECHVPKVDRTATGDAATYEAGLRAHRTSINPKADAVMFSEDGSQANGYLTVDYVCLRCHTAKTKAWAAENAPLVHQQETTIPRMPPGHVPTSNGHGRHPGRRGGQYEAPAECVLCHELQ